MAPLPIHFFLPQFLGNMLKCWYHISFGNPDQSRLIWTNGNTRDGQTFVFLNILDVSESMVCKGHIVKKKKKKKKTHTHTHTHTHTDK